MGTRCGAVVIDGERESELYYRHWDGYPSNAGAALLSMAEAVQWDYALINDILQGPEGDYDTAPELDGEYLKLSPRSVDFEPDPAHPLGDMSYMYVLDCRSKKIYCFSMGRQGHPASWRDLRNPKVLCWK